MNSYDRVRDAGVTAASPVDLLAVGLARREEDVSEAPARDLLQKLGNIARVAELSAEVLKQEIGLTAFEAARAQSLIELGRRTGGAGKGLRTIVEGPEDVAAMFDHLRQEKREHFVAVFLDAKAFVLRAVTIHIGTVTASLVGPREVFREAIREGAVSLIVAHNHPSGDPTPSPEDIEVTRILAQVGDLLDIRLLDHVIIGERRFTSLKQLGVMG